MRSLNTGEDPEKTEVACSETAAFVSSSQVPGCREGRERATSYPARSGRRREGGEERTTNTHQKIAPNFMLLQSSVKSSKRTLSFSWKRLRSASQSVCRPAGVPMSAKPGHTTTGQAPGGRRGNLVRKPRLLRCDTHTPRDVLSGRFSSASSLTQANVHGAYCACVYAYIFFLFFLNLFT